MNRIVTIGREFGSGGRELGRCLAQELGFAYYDREIITGIAQRAEMTEDYVRQVVEKKPYAMFPITVGRSLHMGSDPMLEQERTIYQQQSSILREMAGRSSCVLVGRCADYILRDQKPFRIFVYADMESRLNRCRHKAHESERFTDRELKNQIQQMDKNRAKYYEFCTGNRWGAKENYDMCINTTHADIPTVAHALACLINSGQTEK